MSEVIIYVALILVGLCLGSFAGASVWRLRARQLVEDKEFGEPVDETEYTKLVALTAKSTKNDRSQCLHCHHELRWYDLVPLFSWLQLGGRCRYCQKSIGMFEPLIEIATAAFFVLSYAAWPISLTDWLAVTQLILWLAAGVGLIILFMYDMKWFLLPNSVVFTLIGIGLLNALIALVQSNDISATLVSIFGALMALSGLYYMLYQVSSGAWIGFGDIKLGIALALLLVDWKLALLTLFTANLIGCLVVIPLMIAGKVTRTTRVPFGPMLIAAFFVVGLWGNYFLDMHFLSLLFY